MHMQFEFATIEIENSTNPTPPSGKGIHIRRVLCVQGDDLARQTVDGLTADEAAVFNIQLLNGYGRDGWQVTAVSHPLPHKAIYTLTRLALPPDDDDAFESMLPVELEAAAV